MSKKGLINDTPEHEVEVLDTDDFKDAISSPREQKRESSTKKIKYKHESYKQNGHAVNESTSLDSSYSMSSTL